MHDLIPHKIEGNIVRQRVNDGYVNATAMCKAANKLWADYQRLKGTEEYLEELSRSMGIPIDLLIQPIKTGPNELRGTWVHPQVSIHLAQWLSARFAVQVSQWVYDWMTQGHQQPDAVLPYHLRRYITNSPNVPVGYFSVLQEMTIALIAPMEIMGYTLPEKLWPDISEGRMFAKWLREEHDIEPNDLPTYRHEFEDGRKDVYVRAYPEGLLGEFRRHLREYWLPERSIGYFKKRDPKALEYLPRLLPPPKKKAS